MPPSSPEPPPHLTEDFGDYPESYFALAQKNEARQTINPVANLSLGDSSPLEETADPPVIAISSEQLLSGLNREQALAVSASNGHTLVLAGAGSGKTRVLIHRLAFLLAKGMANPTQIMAVTFTNKAAKEMLARLQNFAVPHRFQMWVGTFHGLCHRFLRLHYENAGLSKTFQILDTDAQLSAVRQAMNAKNINTDDYPPREALYWINARKDAGERADEVKVFDSTQAVYLEIYQAYQSYCAQEHWVDFAELLLRTHEVLKRQPRLRELYQTKFKHLLVDEFQDTNALQYQLLQLMCGDQASIFAVGDDDQSIYGFRGAKVENLRHFERHYANGRVIRLEQSYRSTGTILNAANQLIAHNFSRLGKNLWTAQGNGEKINIYPAYNDEDEARWVMNQIRRLSDEGMAWSEIAILYRINAHSRAFEQAAMSAGIPYRIYGGFRFYDRAEIRHALAYLRLIVNPDDAYAFDRIVNFPPRGIGERTLEQLKNLATQHQCSKMSAIALMAGRSTQALQNFAETLAQMRSALAPLSLPEIITTVLQQSGLRAFYEKQRDGVERLENLDELVSASAQYLAEWQHRLSEGESAETIERQSPSLMANAPSPRGANLLALMENESPSTPESSSSVTINPNAALDGNAALLQFLNDTALDSAEPETSQKSAISLMSVHSAKGLEFGAVFIGGLEHGTFPHENNLDTEEERRLMYVALTRAKKTLTLSFTHQRLLHGRVRQNIPSVFIQEIPKNLVHWVRPISAVAQEERARFGVARRGFSSSTAGIAPPPDHRSSDKTLSQLALSKGIPARSAEGAIPYPLGARVRHRKFGDGFVLQYEGAGEEQRILVNFGGLGQKWLVVALAKLSPVD